MSKTDPTPLAPGESYAFHAVGSALSWDYARAAFAIFVLGGVLGVMEAWTVAWWAVGALFLAVIGYLFNTLYRHGLRVEMNADGVTTGWRNPLDPGGPILFARKTLPWSGLEDIHMRYFSRRKNVDQDGWIMLRLKGRTEDDRPMNIIFDGTHEGFTPVLHSAWAHAKKRGLPLDEATLANMEAMGLSTTEPAPWTS